MEAQLNSIIQALWILITLLGILLFLAGSVLIAEFLRRERTATKDDDWVEFGNKKEGEKE